MSPWREHDRHDSLAVHVGYNTLMPVITKLTANDVTHQAGFVGDAEDSFFKRASEHACSFGLQCIHLAGNCGAGVGLGEELKEFAKAKRTDCDDDPSNGLTCLLYTSPSPRD